MADPVSAAVAVGWGMKAAGWVASPIISELYKKASSFNFDAAEMLRQLGPKILLLEQVMEVVEESPHRPRLEQLFKDLKSAFYEAEDILDVVEYHRLEKQLQDYKLNSDGSARTMDLLKHMASSPLTNKETGMPKKQLKKSLEKIEKVINEAHQILNWLNSSGASKGNNRQPIAAKLCIAPTSPVKVIGRDMDRDKIVAMLHEKVGHGQTNTNSGLCYSVVGIHGIGGSGKSTLARFVYAQEEKDKQANKDGHFDNLMWVRVSQKSSVGAIYRQMLEAITGFACDEYKYLSNLQRDLKSRLSGKKFFLVLDDVWCNKDVREQNLPQLLSPLEVGKRGSKILVTSRNEDAFSDLGPNVRYTTVPISDLDDCKFLELFMYYALGDRTIDDGDRSKLWNIGAHIAEKLKKSPLAASTVGGQLRKKTDVDIWRRAKDRDLLNETMGALSWSYQHLNEQLRRCFAYCSMFPRGHHFRRNMLVNLWVAEGFIRSTNAGEEMEDVGQDYFNELVSISFLQLGGKESWGKDYYLMHDLVHDLAERIAGSDCDRIEKGWKGKILPGVRHLYIDKFDAKELDAETSKMENLSTLIIRTIDLGSTRVIFRNIITRLQKLRVLHVGLIHLGGSFNILESIDHLKQLRHLTFRMGPSSSLTLPRTCGKLHHMQTLDFGSCRRFELSKGEDRVNLFSLRHVTSYEFLKLVNIARSTSLQQFPKNFRVEIQKREKFGENPFFEVSKEKGYNIKQLRDLNKLHGRMKILGLENVKSKEEALEAKLADKERLTGLALSWGYDENSCNPEVELEVLEGLCPPKGLEELALYLYSGTRYPNWMVGGQNGGPERLQILELSKCSLLELTPVSEVFTHLRVLILRECNLLTLPDNMEHLKSLKKLSVYHCPNIQSLPVLPQSLEEFKLEWRNEVFMRSSETIEEIGPSNRMKGVRFDEDVSIIGA